MGKIMKKYLFSTLFLMLVLLGTSFAQESHLTEPNAIKFTAVYKGLTYYVKNSGNDLLDGRSDATAWKTLAKVQATSFRPGDNIYLKRGDIWAEDLSFPGSGAVDNVITLGAYGTVWAKPTINRLKFYRSIDWYGNWSSRQYVTVQNIRMQSVGSGAAVQIEAGNNIIFDNCFFDGRRQPTDVIKIYGKDTTYASDILIKNSRIIDGGVIDSDQFGGVQIVNLSKNITVQNCILTNNSNFGVQMYSGTYKRPDLTPLIPTGLRVRDCIITNDSTATGRGINVGWCSEDVIIERNYIEGHKLGLATDGGLVKPAIFRNNIVVGSQQLFCVGNSQKTIALNNTFVAGDDTINGVWYRGGSGSSGHVLKNNIIVVSRPYNPSILVSTWEEDTLVSDNNIIFSTTLTAPIFQAGVPTHTDTIEDWRRMTGQDMNSIIAEPHLSEDYRLTARSPGIGAGATTVLYGVTDDYFETTRTEPYDIGALAY
jgi:hypothetical protein